MLKHNFVGVRRLFGALCLLTPLAAHSFDLEQAAVLEAQFRSIAVQCGDSEFATQFISNSKLNVAAMLHDSDQAGIDLVESAISTIMADPAIANIPADRCPKLLDALKQLQESRMGALKLSQELSKSIMGRKP